MVDFTTNITPIPLLTDDQVDILNRLNTILSDRIENLRIKYDQFIPDDVRSRFLIDGRIRHNGALEEVSITPMENVDPALWETTLQFILI